MQTDQERLTSPLDQEAVDFLKRTQDHVGLVKEWLVPVKRHWDDESARPGNGVLFVDAIGSQSHTCTGKSSRHPWSPRVTVTGRGAPMTWRTGQDRTANPLLRPVWCTPEAAAHEPANARAAVVGMKATGRVRGVHLRGGGTWHSIRRTSAQGL